MSVYDTTRADVGIGTGTLKLQYFTSKRSETITQLQITTGSTAATAATLFRLGVYTLDRSTGNGTLAYASTSDTTGLTTTFNTITRTLATPWPKVEGVRYALAMLIACTGSPLWDGMFLGISGDGTVNGTTYVANLASQADLPSSFTDASLTKTSTNVLNFRMIP